MEDNFEQDSIGCDRSLKTQDEEQASFKLPEQTLTLQTLSQLEGGESDMDQKPAGMTDEEFIR